MREIFARLPDSCSYVLHVAGAASANIVCGLACWEAEARGGKPAEPEAKAKPSATPRAKLDPKFGEAKGEAVKPGMSPRTPGGKPPAAGG